MGNKNQVATIVLLGSVFVLGAIPLVILAFTPASAGYAALGGAILVVGLLLAFLVRQRSSPRNRPPAEASEHGVERAIEGRAAKDAFYLTVIALFLVDIVVVLGDLPAPHPVWFALGGLLVMVVARRVHARRLS